MLLVDYYLLDPRPRAPHVHGPPSLASLALTTMLLCAMLCKMRGGTPGTSVLGPGHKTPTLPASARSWLLSLASPELRPLAFNNSPSSSSASIRDPRSKTQDPRDERAHSTRNLQRRNCSITELALLRYGTIDPLSPIAWCLIFCPAHCSSLTLSVCVLWCPCAGLGRRRRPLHRSEKCVFQQRQPLHMASLPRQDFARKAPPRPSIKQARVQLAAIPPSTTDSILSFVAHPPMFCITRRHVTGVRTHAGSRLGPVDNVIS